MKKIKEKPWGISPMGKTLSADCLNLIQNSLDNEMARLEKLHWSVVPFLPPTGKNYNGAGETLRNIALWGERLKMARSQVGQLFEEQFPVDKDEKPDKVG